MQRLFKVSAPCSDALFLFRTELFCIPYPIPIKQQFHKCIHAYYLQLSLDFPSKMEYNKATPLSTEKLLPDTKGQIEESGVA